MLHAQLQCSCFVTFSNFLQPVLTCKINQLLTLAVFCLHQDLGKVKQEVSWCMLCIELVLSRVTLVKYRLSSFHNFIISFEFLEFTYTLVKNIVKTSYCHFNSCLPSQERKKENREKVNK